MNTLSEPNPKQKGQNYLNGQAMSAADIEKMKSWDAQTLLEWIKRNSEPISFKNAGIFLNSEIEGRTFLKSAGSIDFFQKDSLSFGFSVDLVDLYNRKISRKSKSRCFTSCEQQANNATGDHEQVALGDHPAPPKEHV